MNTLLAVRSPSNPPFSYPGVYRGKHNFLIFAQNIEQRRSILTQVAVLCPEQDHTVQPDSFSTVGAFSTVATVLDES